ncbi:uncharacterized protein [Epargyreus clarus]|uniref:uncharacterized protein n=1 Tax=Epargyreus clarus TaxID=520877 RepID=UPI003C2DF2E6
MLTELFNAAMYGLLFSSLFIIDYALGNGLVDMFQKVFCKFVCFVRKTIREEAKQLHTVENTISMSVLFSEILFLGLTILLLQKYKQVRVKDRIDDLLQESREALRQTNEFLEKWRLRRLNYQAPIEYSYLDDEPQKIEPLKLEVPILHMAIIDTMGTTRSQPERGDAGDSVNITDSTLLSVTSLLDDELESLTEPPSEEKLEDPKGVEFGSRYLWDVIEEDVSNLED